MAETYRLETIADLMQMDSRYNIHDALKPSKPAKIMSTGAVVNFGIFDTAEFRSQIRPIQDTLQPWYSKLDILFLNCSHNTACTEYLLHYILGNMYHMNHYRVV